MPKKQNKSEWREKLWSVVTGVEVLAKNKTYNQAWRIAEKAEAGGAHSGACVVPDNVADRIPRKLTDILSVSDGEVFSWGLEYDWVFYLKGETWFVGKRDSRPSFAFNQREFNFYDEDGRMKHDFAKEEAIKQSKFLNGINQVDTDAIDSTP